MEPSLRDWENEIFCSVRFSDCEAAMEPSLRDWENMSEVVDHFDAAAAAMEPSLRDWENLACATLLLLPQPGCNGAQS